jgi:polar amino acid transport system substrate-binding protein
MSASTWRQRVTFAHLEEPPFCFRAENRVTGCDVELAEAILTQIGVEEFAPVEVEFSELLPGLIDGRWMMTTGLFITPARQQLVAFSRPIWALPDGLMVQAGNPKHLTSYATIAAHANARLGVVAKQAQHDTALRDGVPAARIREYAGQDEAARAVAAGEVDAYASVAMAHRGYIDRHPGLGVIAVDIIPSHAEPDRPPPFGAFAFPKTDSELAKAVDTALATYLGSPPHHAMMARYGFTPPDIDQFLIAAGNPNRRS